MKRLLPRLLMAPAIGTLFLWMIVPLVMSIYFSVIRYNLMQPDQTGFIGLANFEYFITSHCKRLKRISFKYAKCHCELCTHFGFIYACQWIFSR